MSFFARLVVIGQLQVQLRESPRERHGLDRIAKVHRVLDLSREHANRLGTRQAEWPRIIEERATDSALLSIGRRRPLRATV
jgi:hypothetical protein